MIEIKSLDEQLADVLSQMVADAANGHVIKAVELNAELYDYMAKQAATGHMALPNAIIKNEKLLPGDIRYKYVTQD